MKLSKYRVLAGHYIVGDYFIFGGRRLRWQVRDDLDHIVEDFATLREAIRYAQGLTSAALSKSVEPATLPIGLAQRLRF